VVSLPAPSAPCRKINFIGFSRAGNPAI
jgi:hypothetical protein